MRQCRVIVEKERPAFAVGTGGYAAGPMLWTCYRSGVAIGLLESNVIPGLTTRLMARRAAQLHLGFAEAEQYVRAGANTEKTGEGAAQYENPFHTQSPCGLTGA